MNFTQLVLTLLVALTAFCASVSGTPEANPDPSFKKYHHKKGHYGHHHGYGHQHHGYGHGHYYRPVYHIPVYYHHYKKW
ncbi:hypothetical protein Pcinc_023371 [Petrolisthes cinctipes]|uniref:Uncharacterized protein n=1 Tax=Petrolisthes cinctipes TaxID=88211 RepID=A0AAE1FD48_PETCI|nr:hypothetical protein Pcinc_023371 [Petrolisthes cinctipes]